MKQELLQVLKESKNGKLSRVSALKALNVRKTKSSLKRLADAIDDLCHEGVVSKLQGHSFQMIVHPDHQGGPSKCTKNPPPVSVSFNPMAQIETIRSETADSFRRIDAIENELTRWMAEKENDGTSESDYLEHVTQRMDTLSLIWEQLMQKLLLLDAIDLNRIRVERRNCITVIQQNMDKAKKTVDELKTLTAPKT